MTAPSEPGGAAGWLLLRPDLVPERWLTRKQDLSLIPLMPGEAESLLSGETIEPEIEGEELQLARLLSEGATATMIAAELGISTRSVERRSAALRDRLGVRTPAELASLLARRGF
jgi:DNA-binding NarL/FixJ family response regulator